ncbi:MAG: CoB--CoM heterodisulfide reductase iron-sulfur subunit B family protein [Anaerolineae bacterium]
MTYAYYPGCTQESGSKEYDLSLRLVCERLGIELRELEDWNCCGAVHTSVTDPLLAMTLPARNLALAEEQGMTEIVTPCSGCYKNFRTASKAIQADPVLRQEVNDALPGHTLKGDITVKHPLYVIVNDYGLERLEDFVELSRDVSQPLKGLQVACYYGCVLTRPRDEFDSPEKPQAMDRLMQALGAEPVPYPAKTKCCGGAVLLSHTHIAVDLTGKVLLAAKEAGADCVALACPMCHVALDAYQSRVEKALGTRLDLPILYFTQLMALALGVERHRLGFKRHMVSPAPLLERLGF